MIQDLSGVSVRPRRALQNSGGGFPPSIRLDFSTRSGSLERGIGGLSVLLRGVCPEITGRQRSAPSNSGNLLRPSCARRDNLSSSMCFLEFCNALGQESVAEFRRRVPSVASAGFFETIEEVNGEGGGPGPYDEALFAWIAGIQRPQGRTTVSSPPPSCSCLAYLSRSSCCYEFCNALHQGSVKVRGQEHRSSGGHP